MKKLSNTMEKIYNTSSTLEKEQHLYEFLCQNNRDENYIYTHFLSNTILPIPQKLGVASASVIKAVSQVTGHDEEFIKEKKKEFGTTSEAVEYCFNNKIQMSFFEFEEEPSSIRIILKLLQQLPDSKNNNEKINNLQNCFSDQDPQSAKYLSHFILGDLSIGYDIPILLKAVARYLHENEEQVKQAYNFIYSVPDIIISNDLTQYDLKPHRPFAPQLADVLKDEDKIDSTHIIEEKFDGGRILVHLTKDGISFFTRNFEDVTQSFPEVFEQAKQIIDSNKRKLPLILDTEFVTGNFASFNTRIKRKNDVEEYARKSPTKVYVYDIVYCKKPIYNKRLNERKNLIDELDLGQFNRVNYNILKSKQDFEYIYSYFVHKKNAEGIMVKNLFQPYKINERNDNWLKKKPEYTVDLYINSGNIGTGKNANQYSSFSLSTSDGHMIGYVGTGITDELKSELNTRYENNEMIVLEIAFDSIQESTKTSSGYVLRFPKVIRIRDDKSLKDTTSLDEILKMVNIT